jgi:LysM repeat protein
MYLTYTIKDGDTLTGIALKFYGNAERFDQIWNANKLTLMNRQRQSFLKADTGLGSPDVIFPGTVILLPGLLNLQAEPPRSKVVEAVSLEELGARFRANSRSDVDKVALFVRRHGSTMMKYAIAGFVMHHGLMKPKRLHERFALWLIRKVHKNQLAGTLKFVTYLDKKEPGSIYKLCEATSNWIARGLDTADEDSVGGWSQAEMDKFRDYIVKVEELNRAPL